MKFFLLLVNLIFIGFAYGQWTDVGGGNGNSTHGLLTWDGKLVNLGSFNNAPCNRVATWDGTSWSCLGGGVGIVARAGVVWDGKLVVVGDFWNVQQPCVGCNGVAVWDGVAWTPLGNGVNNDVLTCTVWNNELVIGGDFTQADGTPIARIAKWNGTAWESVGPIGSFGNDIRCMTEYDGELWVGGDFNNVGGNSPSDGVVKYDPNTANWVGGNSGVDLVGGVNESVRVLYVNPNDGDLYMGGEFPELWDGDAAAQDFNMGGIARYDGSNWFPLGTGLNEYCRAIHEYNGDIIAGGYFTTAGGVSANKIAKWNGTTWAPMGLGFDAVGIDEYVKAATVWNGIFFAGGAYTQCEGNPMNYIAQWYEAPTAAPVAWMTPSTTQLCGSGCVDFLDNSTNAPTTWNWSFPGSNVPTSTLQDPGTVCYSAPGTYTATLQACNAIGCNTQNIDIEVSAGATVSVNDASICGGGPATLTASPSVSGGTFLWSPGMETTGSITVNPGSSTTYSVSYSYLGCSSSATSSVTVGVGPNVLVSGTNSICEGETTVLTATPSITGGTYLWSPGNETTASITVSPLSTTNYTCTYTLNGCASTPVIETVTVSSIPSVTVANESICSGGSATLTAVPSVGGGSYLWSPGNETTASITQSPGTTTTYSVVYSINGCPSPSESATITVGTTPTLTANDEIICEGESVTLTPIPSNTGGSYLWSPTAETTQSIVVSPSTSSSYDVVYTLNGCPSSVETINVNVNPTPIITSNNETICEGNAAILTATPSLTGGSYFWIPGNQTSQTISVSPTSTTVYDVVYTLNGCPSPLSSSTVTVNPTPTLIANDISICDNATNGTITATPSIGGGTYLWSPGNETTSDIVVPATAMTYSVVYTLNGCPSTSVDATVSLNQTPTISASDISICDNATNGTITSTPSVGGGTYLWSPGNETTSDIVVPATAMTYSVVYTLNGCSSAPVDATVSVLPSPSVTVNDATICEGDDGILTATPSSGGGTYLWSPGNETTQDLTVPSTSTTYSVVYTLNGCSSSPAVSTVIATPLPDVSVSELNNVITANLAGATYQWLDCNSGNTPITGETNQSFTPTTNGNYAVQVTMNGCTDVSSCTTISTIGIAEIYSLDLLIHPNPTTGLIHINGLSDESHSYEIIDALGRIILSEKLKADHSIDLSEIANGNYTLKIDNISVTQLIKE